MIHIKQVDDWISVWKDGEQVYSNHRCDITEGLKALGIEFTAEYREDFDDFGVDASGQDAQDWLDTPPS